MTKLEKRIDFRPAYDKRAEGYGIHNMEITFALVGTSGAASFTIHKTEWYCQTAREHLKQFPFRSSGTDNHDVWMASIDIHSKVPMYDNQTGIVDCKYTGGVCYCDGTSLAEDLNERFVCEGVEPVWEELQRWYEREFVREADGKDEAKS